MSEFPQLVEKNLGNSENENLECDIYFRKES